MNDEEQGWCGVIYTTGDSHPFYVGPRRGANAKAIVMARDDVLAMKTVRKLPGARTVLHFITEPERLALVS